MVKSPRVVAAPLSLGAGKHTRVWFRRWSDINLPTSSKTTPQYHMGLMGVLSDVATMFQHSEALRPIVSSQCKAGKDTKGWDRLHPTARIVILEASATNGTSILKLPPSIFHCFLNAQNMTALQADCALTYAGHNI